MVTNLDEIQQFRRCRTRLGRLERERKRVQFLQNQLSSANTVVQLALQVNQSQLTLASELHSYNSQNQHLLAVPPFAAAVNLPENRTTTQSVKFWSENQSVDQETYSPIREDIPKPPPESQKKHPFFTYSLLGTILQSWA